MRTSTDRILTTHVGSLPRPKVVTNGLFSIDAGELIDCDEHERAVSAAVRDVVSRQVDVGLDVVNDGEMSKISYATYIRDRLSGFEGDSPSQRPQDIEAYPLYAKRLASTPGAPRYRSPRCVGPVAAKDMRPLETDMRNLTNAIAVHLPTEVFVNAASPGVIALFQPDDYYRNHESYLYALAEAMRTEYEGIVAAGFVLQLDSPDLGFGRHMMFQDKSEAEYETIARLHVEALNHAVRHISPDRMRLHVCWGNYEGPHTFDVGMDILLPIALAARPQALVFESSNPRHGHEWELFTRTDLPDDKILVPGVIDSTTNFVEHPNLIAQRIQRFSAIVGKERVIAGTDCGFGTFAGFGAVDPDIVYAKLASLCEGAEIASSALW